MEPDGCEGWGPAVVLDCGWLSRAALAGDEQLRCAFRSRLGRPQIPVGLKGLYHRDYYFEGETATTAGLTFREPIDRGVVVNWEDMEAVWHQTFYNELRVSPDEHPVLLAVPPLTPKAHREVATKVMFETFLVPAFQIAVAPVLSLYHAGRTTGLLLDSGHGASHAVAVVEGHVAASTRTEVAGRDVTFLLGELLAQRGVDLSGELLRDAKECLAYVALDFKAELDAACGERRYELPEGDDVAMGAECFRCAEALFQPALGREPYSGIQDIAKQAVLACDGAELQGELCCNVVLAGGSTLLPGFAKRLQLELETALAREVAVLAPEGREHSACLGGAMLARGNASWWITKGMYDKPGPQVVEQVRFSSAQV